MFKNIEESIVNRLPKDVKEAIMFIKEELHCTSYKQAAYSAIKFAAMLLREMRKINEQRLCLLNANGDLSEVVWDGNSPDAKINKFNN